MPSVEDDRHWYGIWESIYCHVWVVHTCRYEHCPGNIHLPLFHDKHILVDEWSYLRLAVGSRGSSDAVSEAVFNGCRDASAHWVIV